MAPHHHKHKLILLFFIISLINTQTSLGNSPQNIETFYPYSPPPSAPTPPSVTPPVFPTPTTLKPPPPPPPPDSHSSPSRKAIATAVGVTAASTLVVAAALFFLCTKYATKKRKEGAGSGPPSVAVAAVGTASGGSGGGGGGRRLQPLPQGEFTKFDGHVKGLIVDEDGLDVLYWRKLEGSQRKSGPFHKEPFSANNNIKSSKSNGKRLFSRGRSSSSSFMQHPQDDQTVKLLDSKPTPPPPPPVQAPPPPPPPPPPVPARKGPAPPPPPPVPARKGPAPPPPPPMRGGGGSSSSSKPPPVPKRTPSGRVLEAIGEDASNNDQVKMKPLHWEKVNVNTDHSMVWDKIERGSFQYNGDMMEALFGSVAANRKSPKEGSPNAAQNGTSPKQAAKIFILDSRRSQNIAIVIRSLGITRNELINGLKEGRGLNIDTLEKLTRIAPTREEKITILAFEGDVLRLADAESFLYHILKEVPTAFTRVNAMLFRYTYDSEIENLKESLQTFDAACTELRSRGVFLKLLEAILKAGNRLNAGTARGDARAFNLTALRKLSDYKSSDGKTTLLHFVVHEVVRNEGRRCVMNRNNSLTRSNSQKTPNSGEQKPKEEQEREFLQLGLPVVGGLSAEFSNVKKAASIDYDSISSVSTSLTARISETRQLVLQCGADGMGEFVKEMREFLGAAEEEVKAVQEEQTRVMEFVKRTTQYYQAGAFKDKQPVQLFIIVKDFLAMVDKTCVDIARSLQQQQRKTNAASSSTPDVLRTRVTFPRLPDHFLSDKSTASDSDDER